MKLNKYLLLVLLPAVAHAQQGSHGGDSRCEEFYQMASEISISLAKVGQEQVSSINPLIDVRAIREVLLHPVKVTPAHQLNRQALSNPDLLTTQLDVEQWDGLDRPKRIKLVSHELLVLTRKEADGEYLIAQDLALALKKTALFAEPKYRGLPYREDSRHAFTFYLKGREMIWSGSDQRGVCTYIMGDSRHHGGELITDVHLQYPEKEREIVPFVVDEYGVMGGQPENKSVIDTIVRITCHLDNE